VTLALPTHLDKAPGVEKGRRDKAAVRNSVADGPEHQIRSQGLLARGLKGWQYSMLAAVSAPLLLAYCHY